MHAMGCTHLVCCHTHAVISANKRVLEFEEWNEVKWNEKNEK